MNYLDYYELAQEPFSNAPVSRFYFNSPQHSQALVRLTHLCAQMKGLGILVGDSVRFCAVTAHYTRGTNVESRPKWAVRDSNP